jgi:hypothetical protein
MGSILGKGYSWGCNVGRINPMDMTFCGIKQALMQFEYKK